MAFTKLHTSYRSVSLIALIAYLLVDRGIKASPEVSSGGDRISKQKIHFFPVRQGMNDEQRNFNHIDDSSDEQMRSHTSLMDSSSDEDKNGSHFASHRRRRAVDDVGKSREQEDSEGIAYNISLAELKGSTRNAVEDSKPGSHWGSKGVDAAQRHGFLLGKRAYSFVPMRGRKRHPDSTGSSSWPENAPDYSTENEDPDSDRGPESEYFGATGDENSLVEETGTDMKRTSYFVPMRGRKDYNNPEIMTNPKFIGNEFAGSKDGEHTVIPYDFDLRRAYYIQPISVKDFSQRRDLSEAKDHHSNVLPFFKLDLDDMSRSGDLGSGHRDLSGGFGGVKRGSGFFALRGRKSFSGKAGSSSLSHHPVFPAYLSPDSDNYATGRSVISTNRWIDTQAQDEDKKPTSQRYKRASSFTAMRGRRTWSDVGPQSYTDEGLRLPQATLLEAEAQKRAFHALRGKKYHYSDADWKRAFHALRGKRDHYSDADWKRAFHAMRGKKWFEHNEVSGDLDGMRMNAEAWKDFSSHSGRMEAGGKEQDQIRKTKRSPSGRVPSSMTFPHKSRTAFVMKRPLSFFATRGKRRDDNVIRAANDLV